MAINSQIFNFGKLLYKPERGVNMKISGDEKLGDRLAPIPNAIDDLPISEETKVLNIHFCQKQRERVKAQMEKDLKLPRIELTNADKQKYRKTNSIGEDKINDIEKELKKHHLIF